ncbi:MAG: hypothetical protein ACW98I_17470 [Candidatus Hodarchaeales archaeon]|jgi:hypothetical protein
MKNKRIFKIGLIICSICIGVGIITPTRGKSLSTSVTPIWEQVYETPNEERPTQLLATINGGYLLIGSYLVDGGSQTPWIMKVDSEGNKEWNQSYSHPTHSQGHLRSGINTSDGGYGLAGFAFTTSSSTWDLWILKTDENGVEEWNRTFTQIDNRPEYAAQILVASDGGFLISGATQSKFALPSETWNTDYWLIKTDVNGNEEWNKTYRRVEYDQGTALIPLNDGNYLMSGLSDHPHSIWILKIDENGTILWDQAYTKGTDSFIAWERNLIETSDGGFLLTCYPRAGNYGVGKEYWILKCDANGNLEWNTTINGALYDTPTVCLQSPTGDYYVGGSIDSTSDSTETGDMCIFRLNSTGGVLGNLTYGDEARGERILDMVLTEGSNSGEAIIAFGFVETGGSGIEYRDFWLGKFDKVDETTTTTTTTTTTPDTTNDTSSSTGSTSFPSSILVWIGLGMIIHHRRKRGR